MLFFLGNLNTPKGHFEITRPLDTRFRIGFKKIQATYKDFVLISLIFYTIFTNLTHTNFMIRARFFPVPKTMLPNPCCNSFRENICSVEKIFGESVVLHFSTQNTYP